MLTLGREFVFLRRPLTYFSFWSKFLSRRGQWPLRAVNTVQFAQSKTHMLIFSLESCWRSMYYATTGILCSKDILKSVLKCHFRKLKLWSNLYLRISNMILRMFYLFMGQNPTSRRQRRGPTWITTSIWYLESHSFIELKSSFTMYSL